MTSRGEVRAGEVSRAPVPQILPFEHRGRSLPISYLHTSGFGETLLYFHGLGSSKEDFLGAWRIHEWRDFTLVAFDAPGCGATRGFRPGIPLGVDDIVEAARAVVAGLRLRGLTVIGHSMGGLAGLLFALRTRGAVRRLVSVEGNLGPEDCSIYSRRVFRERFLGREEAFLDALTREMRESGRPGFREAAESLPSAVRPRAFFDYCRSIVEYSDHAPLLGDFLRLEVPKLYIHGSENGHPSHISRLADTGVGICSVPDSDHFPMISHPEPYYRCLIDFIRETDE